jgi:hypothetical protein
MIQRDHSCDSLLTAVFRKLRYCRFRTNESAYHAGDWFANQALDLLPQPIGSSFGRPNIITEPGDAVCKREHKRDTKPKKSWFKRADTPAWIGPPPGSHPVFRYVSFTSDLLCLRTVYHSEQAIPVNRMGAKRVEFARLRPSRFTTRWRPNRHQFTIT